MKRRERQRERMKDINIKTYTKNNKQNTEKEKKHRVGKRGLKGLK